MREHQGFGRVMGRERKRPPLKRISPWGVDFSRAFYLRAQRLCLSDRYNLVLHKHLGDVVNTLAAKNCFEEHYKAKLRFLVRPQHEFLMGMYGVEDYALLNIDDLVKRNVHLQDVFFGSLTPSQSDIDHLENHLFQSLFPCVPIEGTPFICENNTNDFFAFNHYWAFRWAANMGVEDCQLALPCCAPDLSHRAAATLSAIAPLNCIVLFAPEAATAEEFESDFWDIFADAVHKRGYTIIVNSNRIAIRHSVSAFALGLSLADVVALGFRCAYVFSLRSGLCDALVSIGNRLFAFYPAMLRREGYGLSRAFSSAPDVQEVCISEWIVDRCQWNDIDFTPALQNYINKLRRLHRWKLLIKAFSHKRPSHGTRPLWQKVELLAGPPLSFMETNPENLARDRILSIAKIVINRKSYHSLPEGRNYIRYSKLFGLVEVIEWEDGSWQSKILGIPLSASVTEENKRT